LALFNSFKFSTKYHDTETSLYYYGLRFYSPDLGKWISRDLVGELGGLNLTGFLLNSFGNSIDPFGLCPAERQTQVDNMVQRILDSPAIPDPIKDALSNVDQITYRDSNYTSSSPFQESYGNYTSYENSTYDTIEITAMNWNSDGSLNERELAETLIHEAMHAAGEEHPTGSTSGPFEDRVEELRDAFFAAENDDNSDEGGDNESEN